MKKPDVRFEQGGVSSEKLKILILRTEIIPHYYSLKSILIYFSVQFPFIFTRRIFTLLFFFRFLVSNLFAIMFSFESNSFYHLGLFDFLNKSSF